MNLIEVLLIAVGLSMDAFAVSVGKGLTMHRIAWKNALVIALFFGVFQAGMPVLGWALASGFSGYIESVDHWIAFGLLVLIGSKMIWDAWHEKPEEQVAEEACVVRFDYKELLLLAIATSIDALAVGITFAAMQVNLFPAVLIIGATTFVLSLVGVVIGNRFGARYEKAATVIGGIILIAIGVKVLIEHLGLLG